MIPESLPLKKPSPDHPTILDIYYSAGPDLEFVFLSLFITTPLILFHPAHSSVPFLPLAVHLFPYTKAVTQSFSNPFPYIGEEE